MGVLREAGIGTMNEMSLHSALKDLYVEPGDLVESEVGRYVVDIVKQGRLVEIQSGNFAAFRRKLGSLLEEHVVHLVYPVAQIKYIAYISPETGERLRRRKSPKEGTVWDVFSELVYMPSLLTHPNLRLEVLLVVEEEVRCADGRGSWRRNGVSIIDRRLMDVVESRVFSSPRDYVDVLPQDLPEEFSNKELGQALQISTARARTITYTLREAGIIHQAGKKGNQLLYRRPN
ncbi:MAG TPA: hypothetical protein GX008_00975 [Firmicutes bacterium]|nr:hypothetical protein [Bacillota bacterium]